MNTILETRSLHYIAEACGGKLLNASGDARALGVSIDSRAVARDQLFIAIKGDRFDGHQFVTEVWQRGAIAAVVEKAPETVSIPCVVVKNTREALGRIAARYRSDFKIPFVAVGGSNGKTSAKELIASVLREKFETVASEASFNNDIGAPLTLLKLRASTGAAVLEVGSNHPGELEPLLRMIRPDIGVITSIGREHLEFFQSIEGVLEEEGKVAELLPATGALIIDGDGPHAPALARRAKARVIKAGFGEANDYQITAATMTAQGMLFTVRAPDFTEQFRINFIGRHQALNATYALAVGKELGLGRSEIQNGLDRCKPAKWRLEPTQIGSILILNDAYNANADSMLAALQTLRDFPAAGRKIAILGEMAELGHFSEQAHLEVGAAAANARLNLLVTIGPKAAAISRSAIEHGLNAIEHFKDRETAAEWLAKNLEPNDVALVKASRSGRLELLVETLSNTLKK